jgi:hypothetical protein
VPSTSICIEFGGEISTQIRSRIAYALAVFAAVYGYRVVPPGTEPADFCCLYGTAETLTQTGSALNIPTLYTPRHKCDPAPVLKNARYANQDFFLVHGTEEPSGNPDWFGEIFEWLSSSLELPVTARDSVGRIPYCETVFNRQEISPLKPHAAMLMAWLENALKNGNRIEELPRAVSPIPGIEHMVICSHDIDFHFTDKSAALRRIGKNLGISLKLYRSSSFFVSNARMLTDVLRGKRTGDYIPGMLDAIENCGFRSTLFVVADGNHRRDPDYRLQTIVPCLKDAARRGFSVGVHASYGSAIENDSLPRETDSLEQAVGQKPAGNRQHWLRFDRHDKLYRAVENARLLYDSSLGFSETCGFRNGASFAFPPYDLERERPHSFLEIPLVIMDGNLQQASRTLRKKPQQLADDILSESRKWGWGGISILWHNPMEPIQVPEEINRVFWSTAKKRNQYGEHWMSADQFLVNSLPRYQAAGLLKEFPLDA